jgi:predicted transposase/invertase (TIGR01784 family)
MMQDPLFPEVFANWEEVSRNPSAILIYEAQHKRNMDKLAAIRENEIRQQQKYEEGFKKGFEEGLKKAIKEAEADEIRKVQIKIAKKLLLNGRDLNEVAHLCSLSIKDVEQIKANLI